jgi:lysozyme
MTTHSRRRRSPHPATSHPAAHSVHKVASPTYTIRGIDVSHHNEVYTTKHGVEHYKKLTDWTEVKGAGNTFAFARASRGLKPDQSFTHNWPSMKAAGLIRGAFHYALAKQDNAADQAKFFYDTVQAQSGDLYLALDLEADENQGVSTTKLRAFAQAFLDKIQSLTGKPAIFYSFSPFIKEKEYMNDPPTNWGCPLWLADYKHHGHVPDSWLPKAWSEWTFWQWNHDVATPGLPHGHGAEQDYFKGTLDELKKLTYA